MPVVAGFDPSIVVTGYAVVRDGKRLLDYGDIRLNGKDISQRLGYLMERVEGILHAFNPEIAVVEKPPPFSYKRSTDPLSGKGLNAGAIIKCSYAMAVITGVFGRHGIYVDEFDAHRWKICAGRNMGKKEMIGLARTLFPQLRQRQLSSHVAEALCMAFFSRGPNKLIRIA